MLALSGCDMLEEDSKSNEQVIWDETINLAPDKANVYSCEFIRAVTVRINVSVQGTGDGIDVTTLKKADYDNRNYGNYYVNLSTKTECEKSFSASGHLNEGYYAFVVSNNTNSYQKVKVRITSE